jgi:hypothetical protein
LGDYFSFFCFFVFVFVFFCFFFFCLEGFPDDAGTAGLDVDYVLCSVDNDTVFFSLLNVWLPLIASLRPDVVDLFRNGGYLAVRLADARLVTRAGNLEILSRN